jgi:hypothetical protein
MNTVLTTLVSKVVETAETQTINLVLARNTAERRFMLSYADRFCLLFSSEVKRVLYKRDTGTRDPWFLYRITAGSGTIWFGVVDQPVALDFAPDHVWWPDKGGIYGRTSWAEHEWGGRPSAAYDRFVGTFDPSKGSSIRKTAWEHLLAEAV